MTKLATAVPKPRKQRKKTRTPLQRSRTPIARGPVKRKNAKRKASEFARTYHSRARVEFIQSLPCIVGTHGACIGGPSENAHVIDDGTKGASRKSGFACIAPLCRYHHTGGNFSLHRVGSRAFESYYSLDLTHAASQTEKQWQSHAATQERNHR